MEKTGVKKATRKLENKEQVAEVSPSFSVNVKVKVAQSCLTLFDPMDCTINGIL